MPPKQKAKKTEPVQEELVQEELKQEEPAERKEKEPEDELMHDFQEKAASVDNLSAGN